MCQCIDMSEIPDTGQLNKSGRISLWCDLCVLKRPRLTPLRIGNSSLNFGQSVEVVEINSAQRSTLVESSDGILLPTREPLGPLVYFLKNCHWSPSCHGRLPTEFGL